MLSLPTGLGSLRLKGAHQQDLEKDGLSFVHPLSTWLPLLTITAIA